MASRKITRKQMERFIRKCSDVLHVKVLDRFKDDMYEMEPDGFARVDVLDYDPQTLGVSGLRLTGSGDDFFFYHDGTYEGFGYRNRYGTGIVVVEVSLRTGGK